MRLICPSCHAHHSAEAWLNEADARLALLAAAELPGELGPVVIRYLGLFRPAKRGLAWDRTLKRLVDIATWLRVGHIRRHGRDWPVSAQSLRVALETMLARRDKLDLPLADHAYLLSILAGQADRAEGQAEQARESERKAGRHRTPVVATDDDGSQLLGQVPVTVGLLRSEITLRKTRFKQSMTRQEAAEWLSTKGWSSTVCQRVLAQVFDGA